MEIQLYEKEANLKRGLIFKYKNRTQKKDILTSLTLSPGAKSDIFFINSYDNKNWVINAPKKYFEGEKSLKEIKLIKDKNQYKLWFIGINKEPVDVIVDSNNVDNYSVYIMKTYLNEEDTTEIKAKWVISINEKMKGLESIRIV